VIDPTGTSATGCAIISIETLTVGDAIVQSFAKDVFVKAIITSTTIRGNNSPSTILIFMAGLIDEKKEKG
jgi:hypothetical protein